jgi:hypothetical protein
LFEAPRRGRITSRSNLHSSIRISCVVRASVEHAVQAVHDRFQIVAVERAHA